MEDFYPADIHQSAVLHFTHGRVPTAVPDTSEARLPACFAGNATVTVVGYASSQRRLRRSLSGRSCVVQVRVLHSVNPPDDRTNPFVDLHVGNLPSGVRSHWFSWRSALFGRYDVVHFQWPESLLRGGGPVRRLIKQAAFSATVARLRACRIPTVVTVHNLAPHESPSRLERWILRDLHRRASALVALNDTEDLSGLGPAPVVVIPHGDYRQRYGARDPQRLVGGRVTFFGSIRSYKNIPALITAATAVENTTVVIAGKPWTPEVEQDIRHAAAGHANVRLELRELRDDELIDEISSAEIVALPYTSLYNSGAIFLALTLGVPVLAPSTATTREIQVEVGGDWVALYEGELSATAVEDALRNVRRIRSAGLDRMPDLSKRDWVKLGEEYGSLYASVAAKRTRKYHAQ